MTTEQAELGLDLRIVPLRELFFWMSIRSYRKQREPAQVSVKGPDKASYRPTMSPLGGHF